MNDLIKIPVVLSKAYPIRKVNIGRQGENEYREVVVSTADFANGFEDYSFAIIYKRPDGITYPVSISMSPDTISWIIKSYDVEVIGVGCFEIRLLSGDSIGKSTIIECVISPSLDGEELPPPAPAPDWLTEVAQDKQAIANALATFDNVTLPEAVQAVEDKADTEITRVGNVGDAAVSAVNAAGATQTANAKAQADRAESEADEAAEAAAEVATQKTNEHNESPAAHADIRDEIDSSDAYAQAVAHGYKGTPEQYYAAVGNITEHNPINVMYPPSPLAAPTGDGETDDYDAIQAILDYAWEYRCGEVYFPQGIYCVTKPLLLKTKYEATPVPWWTARGVKIRGFDKATSRIYKTTNQTLTGINAEHVDGIDAVVILYDPAHKNPTEGTGTGCGVSDMYLYNQSEDATSMVIGGDANERTEFKHLNVTGKQGIIFDLVYCSHFYDIVFNCDENALYIPRGNANTFDRLFVAGGHNPYTIHCSYSHIGLIYGDDCTGAVFDLAGAGLYASSLGTESEKAQYIVKCDGYQNGSRVLISHLHFHRQTGDTDLPLSDCAVFYGHGRVKCDRVSILENDQIVGNSYISKTDETAFSFVADVGQISYQKNYSGDNNPKLLDSPSLLKEYKLRHIRTVTLETQGHISFSTDENGIALNLKYMEINAFVPAVEENRSVLARINGLADGYYDQLQGNTAFTNFTLGYVRTGGAGFAARFYAEAGIFMMNSEMTGYSAESAKDGFNLTRAMNSTPVSAITSFTTYFYKLPAGTVFVVKGIDA